MVEHSGNPKDAKIFSLEDRRRGELENRKREVARLLNELSDAIKLTKDSTAKAVGELRLLADLPVLDDRHIGENTVDINLARQNLELKNRNANWVSTKEGLVEQTRGLLVNIRDAIWFLYGTKFKEVMTVSKVMSEDDMNAKYMNPKFR
ncbi:MAG: hypothetical protein ACD_72C00556G0001 [uncultured bacterium]|nr:MAG: hypothetical protein ACD_72C00556G0001 [uncultured bacterium]